MSSTNAVAISTKIRNTPAYTKQEIATSTAKAIAGLIAHIANNRLDQQVGDGNGNLEDRNFLNGPTSDLKGAADIGVLQGKSELDAEEAKTEIPYLPETELRFVIHEDV